MIKSTINYFVSVAYGSHKELDESERTELCEGVASALNDANNNGKLDSTAAHAYRVSVALATGQAAARLPARKKPGEDMVVTGWNAALDEVARLNAALSQQTEQSGLEATQFCDDVTHDDWRRDGFPCPACAKKATPRPVHASAQGPSLLARLEATAETLESMGDGGLDVDYEVKAVNAAVTLLEAIYAVLNGPEWDSDTPSSIAALMADQGMAISDSESDQ